MPPRALGGGRRRIETAPTLWRNAKQSRTRHLLTRHLIDDIVGRVGNEPADNEPAPLIRPLT